MLLCGCCRLAAASPAERKARGHLAHAGRRITAPGDLKCLAWLKEVCYQQLEALPTTLKQDQQALAGISCNDEPLKHVAMQWRIAYKGAIRNCIIRCESYANEIANLRSPG